MDFFLDFWCLHGRFGVRSGFQMILGAAMPEVSDPMPLLPFWASAKSHIRRQMHTRRDCSHRALSSLNMSSVISDHIL